MSWRTKNVLIIDLNWEFSVSILGHVGVNVGYSTDFRRRTLYKFIAFTYVQGFRIFRVYPKGPCAQIVYTLALKYFLYGYLGPKVYTLWVHGPLGLGF